MTIALRAPRKSGRVNGGLPRCDRQAGSYSTVRRVLQSRTESLGLRRSMCEIRALSFRQ